MLRPIPASECDRAREAASACLDGEAPELEAAYLAAHREVCAACDSFAFELEATAHALRAAPVEAPSRTLVFPRLRRPARQLTVRAATGVAAAAAVLAFVAGHVIQPAGPGAPHPAATAKLGFPPAHVPEPFSAYFSVSSQTKTMQRVGPNVAV